MTGRKTDKIMMVTIDLSPRWILRKYTENHPVDKMRFQFQNMKKSDGPKVTSKVLSELFIRLYEQFKLFSHSLNLTLDKNTNVNHEKLNLMKNRFSVAKRSKKCKIQK